MSLHGQIRLRKGVQKKVTLCRNPNIGFATKCEVQGPMRPRMCLSVKHIITNAGGGGGGAPPPPPSAKDEA